MNLGSTIDQSQIALQSTPKKTDAGIGSNGNYSVIGAFRSPSHDPSR
jgi:hypothetical protein